MLKFSTEYYRTIAKDTNAEKTVAALCDEIDRLSEENSILKEVGESANRLEFDLFNSLREIRDTMSKLDNKCPTCGRIGDPTCKTIGCPD